MTAQQPDNHALIQLREVTKHYRDGDVTALDCVSLDVANGEFLSIVGKSGSGKSTLLNLIGALDQPSTGDVFFRGNSLNGNTDLDRMRAHDSQTGEDVMDLLTRLHTEHGTTLIVVTHDQSIADRAERLIQLVDGKLV